MEKKYDQILENIKIKGKFFWDFNDTELTLFKQNFLKEEFALVLLDLLIYYNETHIKELIKSAIRKIEREIWLSFQKKEKRSLNTDEIIKHIKEYYKYTFVFPISKKNEITNSGTIVLNMYRNNSEDFISNDNYKSLEDFYEIVASRPKCVIFVDDIIGTGKQFEKFCNKKENQIKIEEIIKKNPEINFYYLVFSAYKDTLFELNKKFTNLKIIPVEIYDLQDKITDSNNEYWEIYDLFDSFKNMLQEEEKTHKRTCEYSLDLPLMYAEFRQQNTSFEYYWKEYDANWKSLKRR